MSASDDPSRPITVRVRFHGPLRRFVPSEELTHTTSSGTLIRRLIRDLGVPGEHLVYTMCLANDRRVPLDTCVADGDCIDVFQPVAGG